MAVADHEVVKVYDRSTGALVMKFRPFGDDVEKVRVTLGDVNGDGVSDIITYAADHKVRAFDGETGIRLAIGGPSGLDIFGTHGNHIPSIAAADFNGDGIADIVVGEGKGGGRIKIYDGKTGSVMSSFSPFGDTVKGIRVSVSDVNGDGIADILARQGGSEGSVLVFSGATIGGTTEPLRISSFPA
jgi:WD40 repeat protein